MVSGAYVVGYSGWSVKLMKFLKNPLLCWFPEPDPYVRAWLGGDWVPCVIQWALILWIVSIGLWIISIAH